MTARHTLPPLPYAPSALAPVISPETLAFHHGKHHQTYIDRMNTALEGRPELADLPLDQLVIALSKNEADKGFFNNAAQSWNHDFYWKSLTPNASTPSGRLAEAIKDSFGDLPALKAALKKACLEQFGSGWAWLVADGGKLSVVKTPNAETPLTTGAKPLLTIDVWEHAYYLDFQNKRDAYADAVLDSRLNWAFAEQNLG